MFEEKLCEIEESLNAQYEENFEESEEENEAYTEAGAIKAYFDAKKQKRIAKAKAAAKEEKKDALKKKLKTIAGAAGAGLLIAGGAGAVGHAMGKKKGYGQGYTAGDIAGSQRGYQTGVKFTQMKADKAAAEERKNAKKVLDDAVAKAAEAGKKEGIDIGRKYTLAKDKEEGRQEGIKIGREEGIKIGRQSAVKANRVSKQVQDVKDQQEIKKVEPKKKKTSDVDVANAHGFTGSSSSYSKLHKKMSDAARIADVERNAPANFTAHGWESAEDIDDLKLLIYEMYYEYGILEDYEKDALLETIDEAEDYEDINAIGYFISEYVNDFIDDEDE